MGVIDTYTQALFAKTSVTFKDIEDDFPPGVPGIPFVENEEPNVIYIPFNEVVTLNNTKGWTVTNINGFVVNVMLHDANTIKITLSQNLYWWETPKVNYYNINNSVALNGIPLDSFEDLEALRQYVTPIATEEFFISPTGNSANSGKTKAAPKSLQWFNENCQSNWKARLLPGTYGGDIIGFGGQLIRSVFYPQTGGSAVNRPLIYEAEEEGTVIVSGIDGAIDQVFILNNLNNIVFKGINIDGLTTGNESNIKSIANQTNGENALSACSDVVFFNCEFKNINDVVGMYAHNCHRFVFAKSIIGACGKVWEGSLLGDGSYDLDSSANIEYGITIRINNECTDFLFTDCDTGIGNPIGGGGETNILDNGTDTRFMYCKNFNNWGIVDIWGEGSSSSYSSGSNSIGTWIFKNFIKSGNGFAGSDGYIGAREGIINVSSKNKLIQQSVITEGRKVGVSSIVNATIPESRFIKLAHCVVYNTDYAGWVAESNAGAVKHEYHDLVNTIFSNTARRDASVALDLNNGRVQDNSTTTATLSNIYNNTLLFNFHSNSYNGAPINGCKIRGCNIDHDNIFIKDFAFNDVDTLTEWQNLLPNNFIDNVNEVVEFKDATQNNLEGFVLKQDSPLLNNGQNLTTITANGTSTNTVPVADVFLFRERNIISGGSIVKIGNEFYHVLSIIYPSESNQENGITAGSLILDRNLSFNVGNPVNYPFVGSSPNRGWDQTVVFSGGSGGEVLQPPASITASYITSSLTQDVIGNPVDPRTIGYIVATDYGADPTGIADSSDALIAAWRAAGEQHKVLLLPFGTYRVTKTVYLYAYKNQRGNSEVLNAPIMGEEINGERTTIILDDGAVGFESINTRRAVLDNRVFQWAANDIEDIGFDGPLPPDADDPPDNWDRGTDKNYNAYFINLKVICGNNPGAVGITYESAEMTFISDCIVDATNAYACFYGIPGTGGGIYNCTSIGGQYGVVAKRTAGSLIIGHTFIGHTTSAFDTTTLGMNIIIGFKANLPAGVPMFSMTSAFGNVPSVGTTSFIDGVIESGGFVIMFPNDNDKNFYISNVIIKGTNDLIKSGSKALISQPGEYKIINEYSNLDPTQKFSHDPPYEEKTARFSSFNLIDGVLNSVTEVIDVETYTGIIPNNIIDKHIWAEGNPISKIPVYTGQADGTVVVNFNYGDPNAGLQNSNALQAAIDKAYNDGTLKVFMPPTLEGTVNNQAGWIYLRYEIDLKPGVQLFSSIPGAVVFTPDQVWIDQVKATQTSTPMFRTSGPADAATYVGMLVFRLPSDGSNQGPGSMPEEQWFYSFDWTVGRNSMSLIIALGFDRFYGEGNKPTTNPGRGLRFSGNGGGKHYNIGGHGVGQDAIIYGSNYHPVEVDNTNEPIIFYGIIAPADQVDHVFHINNSSNVMLLGMNTEEGKRYADFIDCTNVAFIGCSRNRSLGDASKHRVRLLGTCNNVLVALLTVQAVGHDTGTTGFPAFVIDGAFRIDWPTQVSLFKKGNFSFAPFVHDYINVDTIKLIWESSLGANNYDIQRKIDDGSYITLVTDVIGTTYSDIDLEEGKYQYQIRAKNDSETSVYSDSNTITIGESQGNEVTDPSMVLASVVNDNEVTINWSSVANATRYDIQRQIDGGIWENLTINAVGTSFQFVASTSGAYRFRVRAENDDHTSIYTISNTVQVTVVSGILPPSVVTASFIDNDSILLNWSESVGADNYDVQQQLNSGLWQTIQTDHLTTSLQVDSLSPGTYRFRVRAKDSVDTSTYTQSNAIILTGDGGGEPGEHSGDAIVTGELRQFHKITFTFTGPQASETGNPNPFTDYRMIVTFTHSSGKVMKVHGYFAADGNAGETSATSGNKWRCHFAPPLSGSWDYVVSFRSGTNIRGNSSTTAGSATSFNNAQGAFSIGFTNKSIPDNRSRGFLEYVNDYYLRWSATGEYFIQMGADAPENFLSYIDFDGNFANEGVSSKNNLVKTWSPHIADWQPGNPTWKNNKGKGIIGAVNYLASKGMNVFSFLTLNIRGDDDNVYPFVTYNATVPDEAISSQNDYNYSGAVVQQRLQYDCSRLDQWEIVFEHADTLGMFLHFKLQETECDTLLDFGQLGLERKVYYLEIMARFGHHLALNWNIGEEYANWRPGNNNRPRPRDINQTLVKEFLQFFKENDPYQHHRVIHTNTNTKLAVYDPLLGNKSELNGASMQSNSGIVHYETYFWRNRATINNKKWVINNDEQGSSDLGIPPASAAGTYWDHLRAEVIWGGIMAGGGGSEIYFGYGFESEDDIHCQDWRSRDGFWEYMNHAKVFFDSYLPFWEMESHDELVGNPTMRPTVMCFAKLGEIYAVYNRSGSFTIDLSNSFGTYSVNWYNPRTGGALIPASNIVGGLVNLTPPSETTLDWTCLIQRVSDGSATIGNVRVINPSNGNVVNANLSNGNSFASGNTIDVQTSDKVGSVEFRLNGNLVRRTNVKPYAITQLVGEDHYWARPYVVENNIAVWDIDDDSKARISDCVWDTHGLSNIQSQSGNAYMWVGEEFFNAQAGKYVDGFWFRYFVFTKQTKNFEIRVNGYDTTGTGDPQDPHGDLHNDCWVRFATGITIDADVPSGNYLKSFVKQDLQWSWQSFTNDSENDPIRSQLTANNLHAIEIGVRSRLFAIAKAGIFSYNNISFNASTFNSTVSKRLGVDYIEYTAWNPLSSSGNTLVINAYSGRDGTGTLLDTKSITNLNIT